MEKHGHDDENHQKGNVTEEEAGEDGSNEQFHDGIFQVGSDATPDMTRFMTADIRKSIKAVSSPRHMQSESNSKIKEVNSSKKKKSKVTSRKKSPEKADEILEKPSAKNDTESTRDKRTRKESNFVMDAISNVNIEQRAKEIIKEVRNKEGWSESVNPNLPPIEYKVDKEDSSHIQGLADARAEEIIKRARAFFNKEKEGENAIKVSYPQKKSNYRKDNIKKKIDPLI